MIKHIIVTGHSKGLGLGIATELLHENHHLHGIARSNNEQLMSMAAAKNCPLSFYPTDLAHTDSIGTVFERIAMTIDPHTTNGIYLINNAGIIKPIAPLEDCAPADIDAHLRINLLAPMLLIREFIRHFGPWPVAKRVINISSGAALNPYHGWSSYCVGKAGLDMLTRCVGTEQETRPYPVQVMSVAPGIIDTDMQTTIRASTEAQFIHRQRFVELKENGQLVAPNLAGKKIAELLFSNRFSNGSVTDIREQY